MKKALIDVCEKYGLNSIVDRMPSSSEDVRVKVALLGEFSSGKSSLINGLVGKKVLPALDIPTTKNYTIIQKGDADKISYFLNEEEGEKRKIDQLLFNDYAKGKKDGIVEIQLPQDSFLPDFIHLVDTPGISSLDQSDADITFGLLPQIDAAMVCIDMNKGGVNSSVKEFLLRDDIQVIKDRIVIVLTKTDTISNADDVDLIRNEAVKVLKEHLNLEDAENRVIALSCMEMLNNEESKDRAQLIALFQDVIVAQKQKMLQDRFDQILLEIKGEIVEQLRYLRDNSELDTSEIDQKIKQLNKELEQLADLERETEDKIHSFEAKFRTRMLDVKNRYLLNLKGASPSSDSDPMDEFNAVAQNFISALNDEAVTITRLFFKDYAEDVRSLDMTDLSYLSSKIQSINKTKDIGVTLTSSLALACVTGGASAVANAGETAGAAAAKVALKKAKKAGVQIAIKQAKKVVMKEAGKVAVKRVIALEMLGSLSKIIDEINPINHGATYFTNNLIGSKIDKSVGDLVQRFVRTAVADIECVVEEKLIRPSKNDLTEKCEVLEELRSSRQEKSEDFLKYKKGIDLSIKALTI